ncbi:Zinc-regulated transporter 2 [Lecanosticta acicola]|uniref:Zinc-regulated transporter 2 n=1 Tax=Lecanosticta acicola TaxID=111012 RepID=A0AAI9EEQ7_9PEZI|nr:Zinc-regulated transporter 2 [Lecanosticta acicola]
MTRDGPSEHLAPRWEHIPLSILRAELERRQAAEPTERPACGSGAKSRNYNVGIHVFALILILTLSTLACSFPLIVRRFPKLHVPNHALFLSRHFGTGVLIATAFVHLFPTAYTNLLDPCLPRFWTDVYPAMPGFIAMISVMVTVGIEMFFATKGAGHSHHVDFTQLRGDGEAGESSRPAAPRRSESFNSFRQVPVQTEDEGDVAIGNQKSPYQDSPASPSSSLNKPLPPEPDGDDSDLELDELDPAADDTQPLTRYTPSHDEDEEEEADGQLNGHTRLAKHTRKVSWADQGQETDQTHSAAMEQRLILQCLMLEAGILFHSVFIGLAVSVSTGSAFVVLLIAISFHQTFEGLALGSRIASISTFANAGSVRPWLMCLMYGITTPIGQAIGLGVQGLYDPESQFGLLMVGIMNAISSGLLLYAGLVQLLAEDFLSDQSYQELRGKRRLQACAAVVAGALLMALTGVWA